ncbi:MAG: YfdX family protein [Candidatus Thiodiazotropha sp.]
MMTKILRRTLPVVFIGLTLPLSGSALAQTDNAAPATKKASQEVADQVDKTAQKRVQQARKVVLKDAVTAVKKTRQAIQALDDKQPDKALTYLSEATGKLELVLAREPDLALAPIAVDVRSHDLLGGVEDVKAAVDQAEDLLEDGRVQEARALIDDLTSEIVISTTEVPLGTYPDAIKAATPMIDEGKTDQARQMLSDALDTLVVSDLVIPLPMLRAEALLDQAQAMVEPADQQAKASQSSIDKTKLDNLMSGVRQQLKLAETLGYGNKQTYQSMYDSLDKLSQKAGEGGMSSNWFQEIKDKVSQMI